MTQPLTPQESIIAMQIIFQILVLVKLFEIAGYLRNIERK